MARTDDQPRDLDEVKLWIAQHGTRVSEWWKTQFNINKSMEANLAAMNKRIVKLENKVIWASGVSAGFGALLGTMPMLFKLFGG